MERIWRSFKKRLINIEYAWNILEKLGLRKKLISITNNPGTPDSLAWWMNKEPLRSKPVGGGRGKTAENLGLKTVAHETKDFLAYEGMTRSHTGAPNVFISRTNAPGEAAAYGEGFYTAVGKKGAHGTGITIRFQVDPNARLWVDFTLGRGATSGKVGKGVYVIWRNRSAIRVIPESLEMSPVGYFEFLAEGQSIGQGDQALLWKLKRRLHHSITSGLIPDKDLEEIRGIVLAQIKSNASNRDVVIQEWVKIEGARLKKDSKEVEQLTDSLKTKTYQVDPAPFFAGLTELSRGTDLEPFVTQEWLPSIAKTLKPDIGDRALEHCLFSNDPRIQEFGARVLDARERTQSTPFVRALKGIQTAHGDAKAWFKSEVRTAELLQEKAAYLALHPDLRQLLSEVELQFIEPELEKISNLLVFEKLEGRQMPADVKGESFMFHSYDFPPGGKHMKMGSPRNEPNRDSGEDQFEVKLTKPFEIQITPVTQLQWSLVMGVNPSQFKSGGSHVVTHAQSVEMNLNRPVEQVSWDDSQKFIQKLNAVDTQHHYRLPTEAEREYAARAGTDTAYSFGNDPHELSTYGWYNANSGKQTHDVATLKPNPDGLYDMHGNVWNWVQDWYGPYPRGPVIDHTGAPRGSSRVFRGGSWHSGAPRCRSALRGRVNPGLWNYYHGLRLVRLHVSQ